MPQAAQKAYHKAIDPGKQTFMELAGLEPATLWTRKLIAGPRSR